LELTKLAVVVSIAAPNENVGHTGDTIIDYFFEHGDNLGVALFASQLQGITSKSIKRFNSGLFEPCSCFLTLSARRYSTKGGEESKRRGMWGQGLYMGERDETVLVRVACWRLCDVKDMYSYAPLCEGWGSIVEWRGEGVGGDPAILRRKALNEESNADAVQEAVIHPTH